ncbi:MAG TPA: TonB-dependent receptor, partial [Thermoanaerobaculia bacterium]
MRRSWKLGGIAAAAGLALLLQTQPIAAQSSGANLKGRAVDEQGGALPGVSVTAKAVSTGLTRTVVTDREGAYTFASLIPDTYDVTATLAGFKTIDEKGVVLNVATTRVLNLTLSVAAASAVVTVTAETPLVREQPAIGTVVSEKELETLPLNGRQFANLAVLAPGTTLGYNDDPTKPGQLQVQMNAGSGRNVNYVVDGGDNTDDTIGGALQNFSLEGVQEFTIQTQQYKAEYGRSTGGVLNVVTRTGANAFHGSAFEYFRDKSLNAETESEKLGGSGKSDYRRDQYGASIGGPIVKDAAHFFATYEKTDRKTNFTESPDVAVIYPNLAGVVVPIPFKDELVAAKVTYDASATQFLQARFGYQKNSDKYGAAPTNTPDNLGTVNNKYTSILTGWQSQVSAKSLNEFVFQYTKFDNTISPDSNNPTIYFPNGVISGQNFNTPQSTHQTKYQFKDDFNYSTEIAGQSHDFKFGINFIHEPNLSGDFSTGVANPQFTVSDNSVTAPVTNITQNGGFFGQSTPVNQYSIFLQDDWRPNRRLTVNAGIRYDLWLGFDLDQHSNP